MLSFSYPGVNSAAEFQCPIVKMNMLLKPIALDNPRYMFLPQVVFSICKEVCPNTTTLYLSPVPPVPPLNAHVH